MLRADDDGNLLFIFHNFHNMFSLNLKHENQLVAIAGFEYLMTPIIINTLLIKN